MKTPEEMYYEWRQAFDESLDDNICAGKPIIPLTTDLGMMTYLAGYKAAMDQVADASKVMPDGPRFEAKTVPIFEPPKEEK